MKKKKTENRMMVFPDNRLFNYLRSGKFVALSDDWKHARLPLRFDYELIVMTEGTLYLKYMDEEFTVEKGEYLILSPSDSIREGFKKAYCSFYWIHFTADLGAFPARIYPEEKPSYEKAECFIMPQSAPIPRSEKIAVQMKQLQDLARNNYPDITLNAITTAIITELFGQLTAEKAPDADPIGKNQVYSDIVDYVHRNLSRNIKISEIADSFGYSAKYLSHLFTEIRGMSLKQFIMAQKIETATFYLADSDSTISEIAEKLGFSDVHNFSRAFKNVTGLSPSTYRNTYAKRLLYHV